MGRRATSEASTLTLFYPLSSCFLPGRPLSCWPPSCSLLQTRNRCRHLLQCCLYPAPALLVSSWSRNSRKRGQTTHSESVGLLHLLLRQPLRHPCNGLIDTERRAHRLNNHVPLWTLLKPARQHSINHGSVCHSSPHVRELMLQQFSPLSKSPYPFVGFRLQVLQLLPKCWPTCSFPVATLQPKICPDGRSIMEAYILSMHQRTKKEQDI
jgi:hypothetical protein